MFDFSQPHVWMIGIGAAVLSVLIFRIDTRVEGLKKGALEYRDWCKELGLGFTADFLTNFAVGDKSGMIAGITQGINAMRDETQRMAVLQRVFQASARILWDWSPELREFIRREVLKLEAQAEAEKKTEATATKLESGSHA